MIFVGDPKAISYILNDITTFHKAARVVEPMRRLLGHGVATSEEAENRKLRRFLTPGFTVKAMRENHAPVMWKKAQQMSDLLLKEIPSVGKVRIDMSVWLPRASMDIIGICGFGHDFNNLAKHDNPFAVAWSKVFAAGQNPDIWLVLALINPIFFNLVSLYLLLS
jgi:cytochrome P450